MDSTQLQDIQKQITAGHFEQALKACDTGLAAEPDNPDLLYMAAVCLRYLSRFEDALERLSHLKLITPEHGRACQEEGHVFRNSGQDQRAVRAYAFACQYNPALVSAWRSQLELLQRLGRSEQAEFVGKRLAEIESLPKPLLAAMDLVYQGKILKAEDICRQFLLKVPHNVEGMRLLADIGIRLGVLDDAEFLLESAVTLKPDHTGARSDYIQVLRKKQKFVAALEQAKTLLASEPDNLQYQSMYAVECMQSGDFEEALAAFDKVLDRVPDDPITLTSQGHALKTIGRTDDAIASYRRAIDKHPSHGEAYYSLANLKTYRFDDDLLNQMTGLQNSPDLGFMDRVHLAFALGSAFEDREDYARSFEFYESGNRFKKQKSRYSAERMREEFEAQREVCTEALLSRREASGFAAADPIFIVGLPRAGSTLLEQILASHSQVDGTLELPNILSLSQKLRRGGERERISAEPRYPQVLTELDDETLRKFGEQYITDTRIHRQGAPFFIDKMPNNFRHIGLIKLILPNAKIIDARRHAMSCCFSGYKQLFAEGQEFSYSLEDIGQYYHDYIELMDHWCQVLPGEVLMVNHEDVVDDLEGQVRRLLDFCELPFEGSCVNYHETERNVRTPSSEQVRQPIFRSSLETWQHYEEWLTPLKEALGADIRQEYSISYGDRKLYSQSNL